MSDSNDDEAWALTTERIAQVLADVRKTPCPRSAHCPDDVSRVQFALHIIAEKALAELLDHRAARAASAERVRSVVRKARMERMIDLRSRANRAADDASRAVAMCKDRDIDGLCDVVQELSRIVDRLVEESA